MRNVQYSTFTDIHFSDFCSFIFKVPVEKVKVVTDKEELHGIEIDGIRESIWISVHRLRILECESSRSCRRAH